LRDHGVIQKMQKSYRYKVTIKGRSILTALIAASNATVNTFIPKGRMMRFVPRRERLEH
jgi:hypothetical protein